MFSFVQDSDESEEDDNTTEEERKARQYRKRKAAPGWEAKKYEKVLIKIQNELKNCFVMYIYDTLLGTNLRNMFQ